jgi:hypothetical protein
MNTNPSVSAALLAAPVLVPLVTAVLTTLAGPRPRLQMVLSVAGLLVLLDCALALLVKAAAGETLVTSFGNWTAPLGIEFAIDRTPACCSSPAKPTGLRGTPCCCRSSTACWPAWAAPSPPPTSSTSTSGSR